MRRTRSVISSAVVVAILATAYAFAPRGTAARGHGSAEPFGVFSAMMFTSTTLAQDFFCTVDLKLFDPVEISHLRMRMIGFGRCASPIQGVSVTRAFPGEWVVQGFPVGFKGPEVVLNCEGDFAHFSCPPSLDGVAFGLSIEEARGPDGVPIEIPVICPSRVDCTRWPCPPERGPFIADECGDIDRDGRITATDALSVLSAAVGTEECPVTQCDADRDGVVDASDALSVLVAAVGLPSELVCPGSCETGYYD